MKRLRISVTGKVQGVWFRKYTSDFAKSMDLTGWVRNEPDNSVLIEAQGTDEVINELLIWCKSGSPLSAVECVDSTEVPVIQENDFLILR